MEDKNIEYYLYGSDSRLKSRKYLNTCGDFNSAVYLAMADAISDVSAGLGYYKINSIASSGISQTKQEIAFQIMISSESGREIRYTYVVEVHAVPKQQRLF